MIAVTAAAAACGGGDSVETSTLVGGWESLTAIFSGAVQETAVVELGGKIYVLGGFHATRGVVTDLLVFDPTAGSWATAAPLPAAAHHINAAAVDGKLYVVGALQGLDFAAIGVTWEYDPVQDSWRERAPMLAGTQRGASAVGVVGGIIYIGGGLRAGQSVADLSSYDPGADQHVALASMPEALNHLTGAGLGGLFYTVGGRDVGTAGVKSRVDAYDPVAQSWSPRAALPTARGGIAGGVVDGKIVVVGGEGNPASGQYGVFSQVEIYTPAADSWNSLPPMRTPRHGTGAAGLDGKLYVPGGATREGFAAVDTNEVLHVRQVAP